MSGRSDDNLETIKSRLEVYHAQTSPLKQYYIEQGKLAPIKGVGSVQDIFSRIEKAIDEVK
jgi:adenylate kinase